MGPSCLGDACVEDVKRLVLVWSYSVWRGMDVVDAAESSIHEGVDVDFV